MRLRTLLATARPPFLLLTPACVAVGLATAGADPAHWRTWVALGSALLAHAAVNGLNEVLDFGSGLDLATERTAFSGGSGALPAHPALARAALVLAGGALLASIAGGLVLAAAAGPGLLLYGAAGVALVLAYTRTLNRHPLACLLAPGIGFGPVMVAGTHFALAGSHGAAAWAASALPMALASNLLLVNQVPDVAADRAAGRRHLPIAHGTAVVAPVYALLAVAGFAGVVAGVAAGLLPSAALACLAVAPLAFAVWRALVREHASPRRLLPWMGLNVALTLAAPALLAIGITLGR